uniref:cadherin-related family member 4-like n=1 Tax=Pristiophorus japonicus TaxID=55135 RepID=UPI00398F7F42
MAASMGLIGCLDKFHHDRETFGAYVERLEMFFTANSIEVPDAENHNWVMLKRKRAIFLTEASPEVYETLKNVLAPVKPKSTPLIEILTKSPYTEAVLFHHYQEAAHNHQTLDIYSSQNGWCAEGRSVVDNFESSVTVPENSPTGTRVSEFQATLIDDQIDKIVITSRPEGDFFAPVWKRTAENGTTNYYHVEILLSNDAALDYEWTSIYILTVIIHGLKSINHLNPLRVYVQDVQDVRCGVHFQTPGGAVVHVQETVPPLSPIYTIVSAPVHTENFTYTITDALPASAKEQFSMDQSGSIHVPLNGFGHQNEERNFVLHITISENTNTICKGSVLIVVIPVDQRPPIFTNVPKIISIPENQGPEYYVTMVNATGNRVHYHLANFNPAFQIGEETGIIQTSHNLDLDEKPGLAVNQLVIVAYDGSYRHSSSAHVTVYVMDVNDNHPHCTPPIFVAEIPEVIPVETTLFELTCWDPDYSNTTLSYTIVPNGNSRFKFKYQANSVKVNESLDYDSAMMASLDFRYTAAVIVTDSGTPRLTTTVSMMVTVIQVNEFPPVFQGTKTFSVPENSAVNTRVGTVNVTDADWVYNSVRFSIVGHAPLTFYIHADTGEINTLVPLDFERINTYTLTIQAVDMNYNVVFDSTQRRTSYAQYTINVENVDDVPPVCSPPYFEETIYSTSAENIPIVTLSCTDKDSEHLIYTIVGGNINSRFISLGSSLYSRNIFSYNLDGIFDPTTFGIQIQVADVNTANSKLQQTTTVIVIVHVVPWTTTVPPTTTLSTTRRPVHKTVMVLNKYWKPEAWFMVVLTLVSTLAAVVLAVLLWNCRSRLPPETEAPQGNKTGGSKEKVELPSKSPFSKQFDGEALDPSTGRRYLFNSVTGTRRWV